MVINTSDNKVVDSIKVGLEPESMVIDKNKNFGFYVTVAGQGIILLNCIAINTVTNMVEKKLVFPDKSASPTCLQIDGKGETLYYLENGVHKMNINSGVLPAFPINT